MTRIVQHSIGLHLTQRLKRARLLNDTLPGVVIVFAGFEMINRGMFNSIVVLNITAGILLMVFGVKEWRSISEDNIKGVYRFDFLTGIITILDAIEIYKPWKGFQPAWIYVGLGLFFITKGIFASTMPRRRILTIYNDGFSIRPSPFSSLHCLWNEIESISFAISFFQVLKKNGEVKKISLRRVENASQVMNMLINSTKDKEIHIVSMAIG